MKRIHAIAIASLVLIVSPGLAGCFAGKGATTNMQATMNSGNGTAAQAGDIHVENATLVLGPDGSASATLTTRVVNAGPVPDRLLYATVNGMPADITGGGTDLGPGASVSFGFDSENWINSYGLDASPSIYLPVELSFAEAGLVTMSVLTVPPVGYYEGIAPNPPQGAVPAA